eukprot:CAMPEP_0202350868 /NCGR_PEP_ID=MMETSP1126-20121109/7761_1 /ASSEMBLY_ACC=CAM_ASM_000457 /TAXON_ID=3047 /ORGANISM="Dunaliella tertiolecta, Strain CCMP1320" /LENGTH=163 /DNA_ID=CAMNT_0048942911 /DNA_START=474 /DNA_END=965 /DNA_ORIENTATION=+
MTPRFLRQPATLNVSELVLWMAKYAERFTKKDSANAYRNGTGCCTSSAPADPQNISPSKTKLSISSTAAVGAPTYTNVSTGLNLLLLRSTSVPTTRAASVELLPRNNKMPMSWKVGVALSTSTALEVPTAMSSKLHTSGACILSSPTITHKHIVSAGVKDFRI